MSAGSLRRKIRNTPERWINKNKYSFFKTTVAMMVNLSLTPNSTYKFSISGYFFLSINIDSHLHRFYSLNWKKKKKNLTCINPVNFVLSVTQNTCSTPNPFLKLHRRRKTGHVFPSLYHNKVGSRRKRNVRTPCLKVHAFNVFLSHQEEDAAKWDKVGLQN